MISGRGCIGGIQDFGIELLSFLDALEKVGVIERDRDVLRGGEEVGGKKDTIFIIFMVRDMIGATRESIGLSCFLTGDMLDGKREAGEEFSPAGLTV